MCDKHETLNIGIDSKCPECYEQYIVRLHGLLDYLAANLVALTVTMNDKLQALRQELNGERTTVQ